MFTFKVDFDKVEDLEDAIKANCSRDIVFYKHWDWPKQSYLSKEIVNTSATFVKGTDPRGIYISFPALEKILITFGVEFANNLFLGQFPVK